MAVSLVEILCFPAGIAGCRRRHHLSPIPREGEDQCSDGQKGVDFGEGGRGEDAGVAQERDDAGIFTPAALADIDTLLPIAALIFTFEGISER